MKYVYLFGNGEADGTAKMKNLLGGKGANLAEDWLLFINLEPFYLQQPLKQAKEPG